MKISDHQNWSTRALLLAGALSIACVVVGSVIIPEAPDLSTGAGPTASPTTALEPASAAGRFVSIGGGSALEPAVAAGRFAPIGGGSAPEGFATPLADETGSTLRAILPSAGEQAIRFGVGPSGEIGVRNLAMRGAARTEGDAVVYETDKGASYWSVREAGVEEWLRVDQPMDGVVAQYELNGAHFVATADGVVVRDDQGVSWLNVRAPVARDARGRAVKVELELVGERLALMIDAPDDAIGPLMVDPIWTISEDIPLGLRLHTATRLDDGRVLVAGGVDEANHVSNVAAIYDPDTTSWSPAALMPFAVRSHTDVRLHDGRVLLMHGKGSVIPADFTQAVLYNPSQDSWAIADPLRANIGGPGAQVGGRVVMLPDGKVLLTGVGVRAQIYDPINDTFHPIADMKVYRLAHSLTLLPDGSVLVAGGGTLNATGLISNTAELYVPDLQSNEPYLNGAWVQLPNMHAGHFDHQAVLLEDGPNAGKVLICSGIDGSTHPGSFFFTNVCDLYNPATKTFALAAAIPHARQRGGNNNGGDFLARVESGPSAGKIVFAGGWPAVQYTDIYDPLTNSWTTECPLARPRLRHDTTALLDGSVLLTGGQGNPYSQSWRSTERLYLTADDDDCDGVSNAADICPLGGCGLVTGRVYTDANEDCDPLGEIGVFGVQIRASNNLGETRYAFSNLDGEYQFELPNGTWSLSVVDSPTIEQNQLCGGPGEVEVWGGMFEVPPVMLGPSCEGSLSVDIHNVSDTGGCNGFRYTTPCPGDEWMYCFHAYNGGSAPWTPGGPPGTQLQVVLPAGMSYLQSFIPNNCVQPNGIHVVPNSNPVELQYDLNGTPSGNTCDVCVVVSVDAIPNGGWHAFGTLDGTCQGGQGAFIDNEQHDRGHACSCDPNDKSVSPAGCDDDGTISAQPLSYTVRFQNTGLGPAHAVRIVDPLDIDLQLESMILRAASHPISSVQIDAERNLFVNFDGIALPARVDDEPGSNGYIQFVIAPAVSSVGTQYTNHAEIYFDHNEPVITNEVINTVGVCPLEPSPGSHSQSGLGDGSNPGKGQGKGNSPNGGGNNPNQAP